VGRSQQVLDVLDRLGRQVAERARLDLEETAPGGLDDADALVGEEAVFGVVGAEGSTSV
jgi:hypothetical protein